MIELTGHAQSRSWCFKSDHSRVIHFPQDVRMPILLLLTHVACFKKCGSYAVLSHCNLWETPCHSSQSLLVLVSGWLVAGCGFHHKQRSKIRLTERLVDWVEEVESWTARTSRPLQTALMIQHRNTSREKATIAAPIDRWPAGRLINDPTNK